MPGSDPIDRVEWLEADSLHANDWNPNYVMRPELRLLQRSLEVQGWIQPLLVSRDRMVIDGFHRWGLSQTSKVLKQRDGGLVPCVVLDLDEAGAMMLTVRINRAKGQHAATRMSQLVRRLIDEHGCSSAEIQRGIGATASEVDLLYTANVFHERSLETWEYSRAWVPFEDGKKPEPITEEQARELRRKKR